MNSDIKQFLEIKFLTEDIKLIEEQNKIEQYKLFTETQEVLKLFKDIDFDTPYFSSEKTNLQQITRLCNNISTHSHGTNIIENFDYIYRMVSQMQKYIKPLLPYVKFGNILHYIKKSNDLYIKLQGEQQKIENLVKETSEKVENLLTNKIIDVYKNEFNDKKLRYNKIADNWLDVTIKYAVGLLIFILVLLILNTVGLEKDIPFVRRLELQSLVYSAIQLSLLSLLGWGLWFCSRNYSINKNQAIVYEQKHTMIQVYLAYINVFDENSIQKDAISLEIGKILFDIERPGYVKRKGDGTHDLQPTLIQNLGDLINKK